MDSQTEKELISRIKKDPEAFSIIYEECYPKIYGYVLRRVGHLETAQDITSETFLKAFKNLWRYQFLNLPFSCWLYRIANNEIKQFFRKAKHLTQSLEDTFLEGEPEDKTSHNPEIESQEIEDSMERYQAYVKIRKLLLLLDIKYQEVLTLKYFEKKKIEEICEILGKKEGTVKSLIFRGIEKLKDLWSKENNATF